MGSLAARVLCLVLILSCLVARDWCLILILDSVVRGYVISINTCVLCCQGLLHRLETLGFFLLHHRFLGYFQLQP